MDNYLEKAMSEGDLISIDGALDSDKVAIIKLPQEILENISSIESIGDFNLPIGINFSKSINPAIYLTSLNILDVIYSFPNINKDNRRKLSELKNSLFLGKIIKYNSLLQNYFKESLKKINKKNKNNKNKRKTEFEYSVFLKVLGFLLIDITQNLGDNYSSWVEFDEIKTYINSAKSRKNLKKKWKKDYKISSEMIEKDFVIKYIINFINTNIKVIKNIDNWANIVENISAGSFLIALNLIKNETNIEKKLNDFIVDSVFLVLYKMILGENINKHLKTSL